GRLARHVVGDPAGGGGAGGAEEAAAGFQRGQGPAVFAHPDDRPDRVLLAVDLHVGAHVGEFAPVDDPRFARFHRNVFVGLKARGGGDADQQYGDADVGDVAAVAPPVARGNREEGAEEAAAGGL